MLDDDTDVEIFKVGAVVETAGGTVLVTEEGARVGLAPLDLEAPKEDEPPDAWVLDPATGVSATHRVGAGAAWQAPLAAMLDDLQLRRLRALLEARPVESGEWYGEHARMQLAPGSGCSSRPLWLAWMAAALREVFVVFWAADERAARRGVLELNLGRAARATHVLLPHTLRRQLRRCAYESEDLELLPHASSGGCGGDAASAVELLPRVCPPSEARGDDAASDDDGCEEDACTEQHRGEAWSTSWEAVLPTPLQPCATGDACDGLCWATLRVQTGEGLARLRARRAQAAGDDEAAARAKQEAVMRQLRAKDPGAEVEVTHEPGEGKYILNKISFNGHLFECPVIVNRYSDVKDIVRTATYKCLCC